MHDACRVVSKLPVKARVVRNSAWVRRDSAEHWRPCHPAIVLSVITRAAQFMPPKEPPKRRERALAPLPPGPPWKLVSPTCVLHIIHDEKSFTAFCGSEGLDSSNVSHLLGRISGSSEQPMHVKFWQPLQRLLFLRRHGCDELVPVLGGKGARKGEAGVDFFIASVAAFRDGMPFTAAHRTKLQQFLVESYRSNGQLSNNYMGWGWRNLLPSSSSFLHACKTGDWYPRVCTGCSRQNRAKLELWC